MNDAEILDLPVAEIGPGPLVRGERIDVAHAELLIPMLDLVPPIVVRETGTGWSLIDGQHRLSASKFDKRRTIRAVVVALDDAEALEAAVKANTSHGKALTLAERKAACDKLLATTDWSDRRIAEACGLNRATVAKHRPDDPGGRNKPRVGRDGKTYESPAVAAARERREREAAEPKPEPTLCAREDCPHVAMEGSDLCAWHHGKRRAAPEPEEPTPSTPPDTAPPSVSDEPDGPSGSTPPGSSADEGAPGAERGEPDPTPVPPALPDDWRDRIARSLYLLGCPIDALRPALTADDVIELRDLRDYLTDLLDQTEEQQ